MNTTTANRIAAAPTALMAIVEASAALKQGTVGHWWEVRLDLSTALEAHGFGSDACTIACCVTREELEVMLTIYAREYARV